MLGTNLRFLISSMTPHRFRVGTSQGKALILLPALPWRPQPVKLALLALRQLQAIAGPPEG